MQSGLIAGMFCCVAGALMLVIIWGLYQLRSGRQSPKSSDHQHTRSIQQVTCACTLIQQQLFHGVLHSITVLPVVAASPHGMHTLPVWPALHNMRTYPHCQIQRSYLLPASPTHLHSCMLLATLCYQHLTC